MVSRRPAARDSERSRRHMVDVHHWPGWRGEGEAHKADDTAPRAIEAPGTLGRRQTNLRTNSNAVLATSRQPLSMVSAWPRPLISTISVTPGLSFCCLYAPFAIDHGTVWSFSPEMISSGPRSGFSVSTCTSVHG